MVVTEAMASGLPAITSRRAGASELIEDGRSGLLLEQPGDPQELAEKINRLASDAALRQDMGHAARPAASLYDWDDVAEDTLKLYKKSLNLTQLTVSAKP